MPGEFGLGASGSAVFRPNGAGVVIPSVARDLGCLRKWPPPGFALMARYFFLSCQEEVPKKKARPPRRPAAPGALRCSFGRGGCATRPFGAQTCSPTTPPAALRCSTTQRAERKAARLDRPAATREFMVLSKRETSISDCGIASPATPCFGR